MRIDIQRLSDENLSDYIDYLRMACALEPEMMMTDKVDERAIIEAVTAQTPNLCTSFLAYVDNRVVGRIEFHWYVCLQDGYKMAYVDWLYVLPSYRGHGIATQLIQAFEASCIEHQIDEYFLIQADNDRAEAFYCTLKHVRASQCVIVRKNLG